MTSARRKTLIARQYSKEFKTLYRSQVDCELVADAYYLALHTHVHYTLEISTIIYIAILSWEGRTCNSALSQQGGSRCLPVEMVCGSASFCVLLSLIVQFQLD